MKEKLLTIHTECVIDSAHRLDGYKGKCKHVHGHSWLLRVWFRGSLLSIDEVGILVDFGIVKDIKEELDHKMINDMLDFNPTAENMSVYIYKFLKAKLVGKNIDVKIRLYETAVLKKTYCEYGDF